MNDETETARGIPWRFFVAGALTGAALEYFGDMRSGRRRRHMAVDRVGAMIRRGNRRLLRYVEYRQGQVYGAVEEATQLEPDDNPNPDDNTLRDRIESELFRNWEVPKGDINIDVADGIVEIRGQVDEAAQIDTIEEKVRQIEGVRALHNYLHLPNTPAPNKARVLSIS